MRCQECGKETKNPKFCNNSCSAKNTNRTRPRKHPIKYCKCGEIIWNERVYCKKCWDKIEQERLNKPKKLKKYTFESNPPRRDKTKCINCNIQLIETNSYKQNGGYSSKCKRCHCDATMDRQAKFKQDCVNYKGGRCQKCGYCKNTSALDFHHIDPNKKEFTISKYKAQKFDDRIIPELEKCELICRNCHAEAHNPSRFNINYKPTSLADLIK